MMRLNLGCADDFRDGYVNVDEACPASLPRGIHFKQANLAIHPWPWEDSSVEFILARDIIEHLPNRIATMNEIWRVLESGGKAEIIVPDALMGAGFIQDPTHVSMWTLNSFQYFIEGSFARGRLGDAYGIEARFRYVKEPLRIRYVPDPFDEVYKIHVILEAVK